MRRILLQLTFSLLAVVVLITACGQKGPLYMPEKERPEQQSEARDS